MRSTKTINIVKCDVCCQEVDESDLVHDIPMMHYAGDGRDVGPAYVIFYLHTVEQSYGQGGREICKKCLIPLMKEWIKENEPTSHP